MRIIQITDLHIYPKDEIVNDVDTRSNFLNVLKKISDIPHDMVVLTGDLSFSEGNKKVYEWIKLQLKKFEIQNYHVIGGNHDNSKILANTFNLNDKINNDELYYFIEPNLIFLDTIKGFCSDSQLQWFKNKIVSIKKDHPIVFMHHPPFKSGIPHMDNKYAFKQPEIFNDICKLNNNSVFFFTGHYHNEISLIKNNINMYITPSTYLQIYMFSESFKVDHRNPAFRIIDIDKKQIKTTVRYVYN